MTAAPFRPLPPPRPPTPAARVAELADRLLRLRPSWHDTGRFFEERSEIIAALRDVAYELSSRGR